MAAVGEPTMDPMPLLTLDSDKKLTLNQNAARVLKRINEPIVVIGIVGKYRSGKSFLMNQLLDRSQGFALGPTVQSATKGVWMWLSRRADGPLLLLDTEGQHDIEGNDDRSVQIFVFLIFLSGCLLVNCQNVIDDNVFQLLELVGKLSEKMSLRLDEDDHDLQALFPALFLVVRDFFLDLEIDGTPCTSDQYLEHCLKNKRSHTPEGRKRNMLRDTLKFLFAKRCCVTLPRPTGDEKKLKNVDLLGKEELNPDFCYKVKDLCRQIHKDAKPKRFRGGHMKGPHLVSLVEDCIQAFREGSIPNLQSTFDAVAHSECKKGLELAIQVYKVQAEDIYDNLPMHEREVREQHERAAADAMTKYGDIAVFDPKQEYRNELQMKLKHEFDVLVHTNETEATKYCKDALYELYDACVKKNIEEGAYDNEDGGLEYIKDYQRVIEWYKHLPKEVPTHCVQSVLDDFEKERQSEQMSIAHNSEQICIKNQELATQQLLCEEERQRNAEAEQRMHELETELDLVRREIRREVQRVHETLQRSHDDQFRRMRTQYDHESSKNRTAMRHLQRNLEEKQRRIQTLQGRARRAETSSYHREEESRMLRRQLNNANSALESVREQQSNSDDGSCTIL